MRKVTRDATIVDIARRLSVSAMTVSRALTGNSEVSEKTRKRVIECAREMGYKPNRWARSLVTRRTSMIGVVVPDISHSFFAEVLRGIEETVHAAGFNLLLCDSWLDADKERSEIEMLVGSRVEGLIVASEQPETSPQPFARLKQRGMPVVLVDRFFPGLEIPSVLVDDFEVGRMATRHLIELGHRRIAHIRGPEVSPASLRFRGYVHTLKAHGIRVQRKWMIEGRFDIQSGREAMNSLLALKPRPTAVFAGNDPMAIGAVYACRDAGLRVPGDISVVGAGNIEGAHHPNPFLTTVDWPRVDLGRAAGALLLSAIKNPAARTAPVKVFQPKLLVRQSTGQLR
jgi:LacI family transcriptional regulator